MTITSSIAAMREAMLSTTECCYIQIATRKYIDQKEPNEAEDTGILG